MLWLERINRLISRFRPQREVCVPEKLDFLELIWNQEDDSEAETDKLFPAMGVKAPACLEHIGTVLSLLDRMASCWWVCREGDHLVEYLCGRVVSNARGSLRMVRFGFYDEALLLCRSIGEISNLLHLFALDKESLERWKACSRRERMNSFGPMNVRMRLEELASPLIDEDRYKLLSEQAAHVHPQTRPQSHNTLKVPIAGASIQKAGLLVCLNELALALLPTTIFGAKLLGLEDDTRERIFSASRGLAENIGGATITEIDDYHARILENPVVREQLEQTAAILQRIQHQMRNK